ncbi:unnamed protein product [Gordionus sp. m RMFG-2023]
MATTLGMWVIPLVISVYRLYLRYVTVHLIYSIVTLYMIFKSRQKPMDRNIPRLVYTWFYIVFKISYGLGIIGYSGLLVWFFGLNIILMLPITWIYYFVLALYYGTYFGVLNRDIAEICSDKIFVGSLLNIQNRKTDDAQGNDKNTCFICGQKIFQLIINDDRQAIEKSFRLECGHVFHEFCIRGWCIVGKKQTCPHCKEKVDLKTLFPNPWERLHVMYSKMLDWVRYLIAWQPLITLLIEAINHLLHLK